MSFVQSDSDNLSETRLDQPLLSMQMSKSSNQRWQRKALENTVVVHNSSLNTSVSTSAAHATKLNSSTTSSLSASLLGHSSFAKKRHLDYVRKTPTKTPKKSPGRTEGVITPGRKTPSASDRFIPNRSAIDFEKSQFRLLHRDLASLDDASQSPSKREYQQMLATKLNGGSLDEGRILNFQIKPLAASNQEQSTPEASCIRTPNSSAKKSLNLSRVIPQAPERILDAPDIINDYYLNLLDWSATNLLAVSLAANVYLWNANTGEIQHLLELESPDDYVTSVKWISDGNILAVGNSQANIGLWDVSKNKLIRSLTGHTDRVGSLSWNKYILSSGSRSGRLMHSDVRVADHAVSNVLAHAQEVCGLAWSPDGRFLASGGNDNLLKIWKASQGECYAQVNPEMTFGDHTAAVKAVSWCPWHPSVLATGGGTNDKTIKIWNVNSGTLVNSIDTKSQVCSLIWSPEYRELVSAHGYANNEVVIWKYPSMVKTSELLGHTDRVLHLSLSPDGTTVVSAGADETLRLWQCFMPDPLKKKLVSKSQVAANSILRAGIR